MLNIKTKIYTVHQKPAEKEPLESLTFVPEGFSWWGFIFPFNVFWAIQRKCWLFLGLIIAMEILTVLLTSNGIVHEAHFVAIRIPFYLGMGIFANDFHRLSIARRGYEMVDIIAAGSEVDAMKGHFFKK